MAESEFNVFLNTSNECVGWEMGMNEAGRKGEWQEKQRGRNTKTTVHVKRGEYILLGRRIMYL